MIPISTTDTTELFCAVRECENFRSPLRSNRLACGYCLQAGEPRNNAELAEWLGVIENYLSVVPEQYAPNLPIVVRNKMKDLVEIIRSSALWQDYLDHDAQSRV